MIPLRQAAMFIAAASTLTSLANANTFAVPTEQVSSGCNPRLISAPTFYPTYSSRAAAGGTALLDVTVAHDGSVSSASILESSGAQRLDRAAMHSAVSAWQFEVTDCQGASFPLQRLIAVSYQPTLAYTFSAMHKPAFSKQLRTSAARGCTVATKAHNESVIACIKTTNEEESRLAGR